MTEYPTPMQAVLSLHLNMNPDNTQIAYLVHDPKRGVWAVVRTWLPEDCFEFFSCPDFCLICYFGYSDVDLVSARPEADDMNHRLSNFARKIQMPLDSFNITMLLDRAPGSGEPS